MEVVGVAGDGKYMFLFEDPLPYFYVPHTQNFTSTRALQVRTLGPPESLVSAVQREIRVLDSAIPILDLRTMRHSLAGANGFFLFRLGASLAGAMGILGLALAVVGVYGVVSFAASQRTREIGIYMALGASRRDVLSLILRQGVYLVAAGMVAGLAGAFAISRLMGSLLLVSPSDPFTFIGVTLLLAAIALWACYVPAVRAARVDPTAALRYE